MALEWLPWNDPSVKLYQLAAHRRTAAVGRVARLDTVESEGDELRRREAIAMWQTIDALNSRDVDLISWVAWLRQAFGKKVAYRLEAWISKNIWEDTDYDAIVAHSAKGADLNFPGREGGTPLWICCVKQDLKSVGFLLRRNADPNLRCSIQCSSALHEAVSGFPGFTPLLERRPCLNTMPIIERLLRDERTDASIVDHEGCTPYMLTSDPVLWAALHPPVSFEQLLSAAEGAGGDADRIMDAILALVDQRPHKLQIRDYLFNAHDVSKVVRSFHPRVFCDRSGMNPIVGICQAEYDKLSAADKAHYEAIPTPVTELVDRPLRCKLFLLMARRKRFFELILRPLIARAAKEPKLPKPHHDLLKRLYEHSDGVHPEDKKVARAAYKADFDAAWTLANGSIETLYSEELERLLRKPDAAKLFDMPKTECKLSNKELTHARFTPPPAFAYSRDLAEAARELQRVGVLSSPDAFCDLIQQGRHRLLPIARPELFNKGVHDDDLWTALVLLWSLGVHEQAHKDFDEAMKAIGPEEFHPAPGVKGFDRSFAKAKEYAVDKGLEGVDKILAPLHVIDSLRCSFTTSTIARNIELGDKLMLRFPMVRTKNGHQRENRSYADRKLNLLAGPLGPDATHLLCEVQLLMERYIEIKKIGHLLYEFQR